MIGCSLTPAWLLVMGCPCGLICDLEAFPGLGLVCQAAGPHPAKASLFN